jgi:GH25 family lysozyme M1 (1,4-beta-N-acetylmuramidase)
MKFLFLTVLAIFHAVTHGYIGVDLSAATTLSDWQCLKSQYNVSFSIVRAYRNVGAIDTNAANTIKNALSAGVTDVGVYMFPCISSSSYSVSHGIICPEPEQQVIDTVNYLLANGITLKKPSSSRNAKVQGALEVSRVWLDMEEESPPKWYDADPKVNQAFFDRIFNQLELMNVQAGIYTTKTYWGEIMGNAVGYAKYPLWYSRYDGVNSFDFFVPFADFTEVKMKQTGGTTSWCAPNLIDPDYREEEFI